MDPHHADASIEFWYLKSPSTLSTPLICFKLLRHRRHSVRSTVYVGELFQSLSLTRRDQNIIKFIGHYKGRLEGLERLKAWTRKPAV